MNISAKHSMLTILELLPGYKAKCLCDCGNTIVVSKYSVINGTTQSCGCLRVLRNQQRKPKHGGTGTKLYAVWSSMKKRCYNKNCKDFKYYGAKGVEVCPAWLDFINFKTWAEQHGYKEGLSIDRLEPVLNYTPDNCEWVTISENTRRSNITRYR